MEEQRYSKYLMLRWFVFVGGSVVTAAWYPPVVATEQRSYCYRDRECIRKQLKSHVHSEPCTRSCHGYFIEVRNIHTCALWELLYWRAHKQNNGFMKREKQEVNLLAQFTTESTVFNSKSVLFFSVRREFGVICSGYEVVCSSRSTIKVQRVNFFIIPDK